jgi:hypothetical protein
MVPIEFKRAKRPQHQPTLQHKTSGSAYIHNEQQQQQQPYQPRYAANYMSSKQAKLVTNLSNHHIYMPHTTATSLHHTPPPPPPPLQTQQLPPPPLNFNNDPDELYQKSTSGRSNYDYTAGSNTINPASLDLEYGFNYTGPGGKRSESDEDTYAATGNFAAAASYNSSVGATVWRGSACNCINIATCSRENLNEFLHSKDCVFFAHQQHVQQQRRAAALLSAPPHRLNYYMMMNNEVPLPPPPNYANYVKLKSFSRSDYNIPRGNVKLV